MKKCDGISGLGLNLKVSIFFLIILSHEQATFLFPALKDRFQTDPGF